MKKQRLEQFERIYARNRDKVVVGRRWGHELIDCLKSLVDVEEVPPTDFFPQTCLQNYDEMLIPYFNERDELRGKPREFVLFRVLRTKKSQRYYQEWDHCGDIGNGLYFFLERQSGWYQTSSNKLSAAFCRLRGIDPEDLDQRNTEFTVYLMHSFPDDEENPIHEVSTDPPDDPAVDFGDPSQWSTNGTPLYIREEDTEERR